MTEQGRFEEIVARMVELKDTSELMIDLAYSALMLNSRELADEVQKLEEYVDKMHTEFELLALTSEFKKEEASGLLGLIQIGVATEQIADAAAEMAEVVLRGVEPHPVLTLAIKEAEETVAQRPRGDTRIQVGDILVASGYSEGVDDFRKLASPQEACTIE
jgi:uncharacterized protein with PhoU and TrkA domain